MSKAVIRNGKIVYDSEAEIAKPNSMEARSRREAMKVKHRKDLLQPNQTDYYRQFPEHMKDLPDETKRLLS